MTAKILVVDDSSHIRDFFADSVLRPAGYTVLTATEGKSGLRLAREQQPDLIIADLQMPGLSGLELQQALASAGSTTPLILVTAEGSESIASQSTLAGVAYYLPKPVDVEVMLTAIRQALMVERLERERTQALAALEKRVHQLETLQSIGRALTASLDLDQLLVTVVEAAVCLAAADAGTLYLWDELEARLVLRAVRDPDAGGARAEETPADDWLAAQVVRTNQPQLRQSAGGPLTLPEVPVYPALCVPLRVHEGVVGALAVDNRRRGREFAETDLGPMGALADYAAVAIANARLFAQLQLQSITDSVTDLFNRRHLFALAEREFQRAQRYGRSLAAIMLDIDHFKYVNDTYGHATGDQVLAEVAQRLRANARHTDLIGRYGGEEFVLLLPETELPGAELLAERLRRAISEPPMVTASGSLLITASLGVAATQASLSDAAALIDQADQALYAAKEAGRNRALPFNPA